MYCARSPPLAYSVTIARYLGVRNTSCARQRCRLTSEDRCPDEAVDLPAFGFDGQVAANMPRAKAECQGAHAVSNVLGRASNVRVLEV